MSEETDMEQINIPGIDPKAGIRNSGDEAGFREFLGDVHRIIDERCSAVEKDLEEKNIRDYTTKVHALKTTCRMMGAMELSESFFTLEKMGRENDLSGICALTPEVLSRFKALKPYLAPYSVTRSAPEKGFEKDRVVELLNSLAGAIRGFELSEAEACLEELMSIQYESSLLPLMQRLEKQVQDLDYDDALEQIEKIKGAI